jgi:NAD(P)H-dependent flavin oxidoreductase YrpB (nitropropane dioxygenase family)
VGFSEKGELNWREGGVVLGKFALNTLYGTSGAMASDRTATGDVQAMCLYAGQSVGGVERVMPAREIVEELIAEAERLLRRQR